MTNFEEFGELSPREQSELRLLGEIFPLQKVLCDGIKYQMWRKQEEPLGPPEISDSDLDLARKNYQRELSEWIHESSLSTDSPLLTAYTSLQARLSEIRAEAVSVFDLGLPEEEVSEQDFLHMQSHHDQYAGREDIDESSALRRTIEHTCEISVLKTMQHLMSLVSDHSAKKTS